MGDYQTLMLVLQGIGISITGWALKRIICIDKKLVGFDTWRVAHEKLDDERHIAMNRAIYTLQEKTE